MDLQTRIGNLKTAVASIQPDQRQVLDELLSACKEYAAVIFEFDIMRRMLVDGLLDQEERDSANKLAEQEEYARETLLESIVNVNQVCAALGIASLTDSDSDCRRELTSEEMNLYRLLVMTGL
ncbi:MAG: hypothetical protein HPY50_15230 [Firmicutes bacterium]|nr:hypothetical protein [Bacillota bacterium]